METSQLRTFQRHLHDQCQYLLRSARDLNTGLASKDVDHIFYAIQNLLNAGANISKLLWGQKGKDLEARKRLRESIGICDSSPLRKVDMRNHFEHMYERIERWWSQSARHNQADKIIGPRNAIVGLKPIETFRWFDPVTKDVIFWGEGFNIQTLVAEVERILPKLREEADKPHW